MNAVRSALLAQLARFDDDAFIALANRGLLRRALKDLEKQEVQILEDSGRTLRVGMGEHCVSFDIRGPAHAQCTCAASGICQHILATAIALKRLGEDAGEQAGIASLPTAGPTAANANATLASAQSAAEKDDDSMLAELGSALLLIPHGELVKHAGRAGYRWAWQFVEDLDLERDVSFGGERNIIIGFRHPRVTLRYMGGGVDSLVTDVTSAHVAKQQVAAVLAYRRAHGQENPAPEPTAKERSAALDFGKEHALADSVDVTQHLSRDRLRASVATLLHDCVELGLSHLSLSVQERFATLAVWAQGADYYRLALILRRIADHITSLLERAGDADEYRLFDEMAFAYGLVGALAASAIHGSSPKHLIGQARSRYEQIGALELLGLGAQAWRTPSGYVGLTMLFWSKQDHNFFVCSEARPAIQRGFNPVARYQTPGPWAGLGAPSMATGRSVRLLNAQINDTGRISGTDTTAASVHATEGFAGLLSPCRLWSELALARTQARSSLLSEHNPMRDWVILAPTRWGEACFDPNRQVLSWQVYDIAGVRLDLELVYSDYTEHAIKRIEQLGSDDLRPGTLLVARIRGTAARMIGEPISIVRASPRTDENPVDCLHFDLAPRSGSVSRWVAKFRGRSGMARDPAEMMIVPDETRFGALWDLKQWLRQQAERGMPKERRAALLADVKTWTEHLAAHGFTVLVNPTAAELSPAVWAIQANYLCMQYESLRGGGDSATETTG